MQEDVLGTQRTVAPAVVVVQCARCGKATPRAQARIVAPTTLSDSHSEFEYLCRDCDAALNDGEQDLATDD